MDRVAELLVNAAMMSTAFPNAAPQPGFSDEHCCSDEIDGVSTRLASANLPADMLSDMSVLLRIARNLCEARSFVLACAIVGVVKRLAGL